MNTLIQQALHLCEKGSKHKALVIFEDISQIDTDDIREIVERGRLALQLDENIFALNAFAKVVDQEPDNVSFLSLLASAYVKIGNKTLATEFCQKALAINPEHYDSHVILGMYAAMGGAHAEAVNLYEKAVKIKPSDPVPYRDMIQSLTIIGRQGDALIYAKKLLSLDSNVYNYITISRVLAELGETQEAISYLEKALVVDSACGYVYHELTTLKKITIADDILIKNAEKALKKGIPASERSTIHYSLGKAFDDLKEWEKAFEHFQQGNLLAKDAREPDWLQDSYKAAKRTYTKSFINKESKGSDSEVPVFIVGMPRSGTTLLEQIIASHPSAEGAGELTRMAEIHVEVCFDDKQSKQARDNKLSQEALAEYANGYLKVLQANRGDAERIVDKQPHNFVSLGLIYKLFPNGRIINTKRNPLDTCLSCYFQAFSKLPQTNDLQWLGKTYCMYREAMNHWKKILPEGSVLDVEYEQVVQDIETQGRRVIDFCGLPWDSQCLDFYKTRRVISTASIWQARQPIYTSSQKRWVNYATHLGPLANEISNYLDDEDIAELAKHGVKVKKKWSLSLLKSGK